jgi:hypothetical protein
MSTIRNITANLWAISSGDRVPVAFCQSEHSREMVLCPF